MYTACQFPYIMLLCMEIFCSHASCFVTLACNPPFRALVQAMPLFKCNLYISVLSFLFVYDVGKTADQLSSLCVKMSVTHQLARDQPPSWLHLYPPSINPCLHCSAVAQGSVLLLLLQINSEDYLYKHDSQSGCIFYPQNHSLGHSTALLLRAVFRCCRSTRWTIRTKMAKRCSPAGCLVTQEWLVLILTRTC